MVLHKRLYYGFSGYEVPPVPRAARSARRRKLYKKKVEGNQVCAFDLLASVAGNLILEGEAPHHSGSDPTVVMMETQDENKLVKVEDHDEQNTVRGLPVSEVVSKVDNRRDSTMASPLLRNDELLPGRALSSTSDCSERLVVDKAGEEVGANEVQGGPSPVGESSNCKVDFNTLNQIKYEPLNTRMTLNVTNDHICSPEGSVTLDKKSHALANSESVIKSSLLKNHLSGSFNTSRDNVNVVHRNTVQKKLVNRDDDENSSWCTHPKVVRSNNPPSRVGGRRIRRLLASKYWKVSPRYYDDGESKRVYQNHRFSYKCQKSPKNYPFKKRKFFRCSPVSDYVGRVSNEGNYHSPRKANNEVAFSSRHGGKTSSVVVQHSSLRSRNSHVKLRIKSFRVPELFVEVPETSTVGSLKRAVMDAVSALFGGSLDVGVLVQGKKIKDDNKTLLQTGISHENQPDALGFSLEPNLTHSSQPLCFKDPSPSLPCNASQAVRRYSYSPEVAHQQTAIVPHESQLADAGHFIDSDRDSAPSPIDSSTTANVNDSKALVALPAANLDTLAVVPVNPKAKRCETPQRRIRRPFSVAEVEALVGAVEQLGTGRWRDVKLTAFENAEHRTYVDLKDKWKTLVHTARIAPQQRRGEPVPQELLDRVLTTHDYWSQQQAKQRHNQHQEACFV